MDIFSQFIGPFLAALGSGLAVSLLALPKYFKEQKLQAEEKEKALQEALTNRNAETDRRFEALEQGVRAILKDKIQKEYLSLCGGRRKVLKPYEKSNVSQLYTAYSVLGGNGYISHLYEEIMDMPVHAEDDIVK